MLADARTVVKRLSQAFENAQALHAMLVRANNGPELRKEFDKTYEANGLNIITHALMNQLILTLTKMHDSYAPTDARTSNRASLPHIGHLLSDRGVAGALIEEARDWHPGLDREDANERLVRERIARILTRIGSFSSGARLRWLKTLRGHRNEHLAHLLFGLTPTERAKFGYIGFLLKATTPIIEDLKLAVHGESYDAGDAAEAHEQIADAFWQPVILGMQTQRRRERRRKRPKRAYF